MVIVRLMGGLGNQMFQYAAARANSLRTGQPLKVDLTWFDEEGSSVVPRREYELDGLGLEPDVASDAEIARSLRRRGLRRRPRILADPTLRFDPRVLDARDVRLIGYWQSERYFTDRADAIRAELEPPLADAGLEQRLESSESVSVHVRRGDYAADATVSAELGTLTLGYYRAAVALVRERVPASELYVFSDEPAWAAANLGLDDGFTLVESPPGARPHHHLRLMSRCRHHVVANSSYSWWGAWLRERPGSVVVAPTRWFAASRYDTSDLVPARWARI